MSDERIQKLLHGTLAGKIARELDAKDGNPNDGEIEASVWNEFVKNIGTGKEIQESIDVVRAMNSITTYCVREGAKDNGKTGTQKAKEWDIGLDTLVKEKEGADKTDNDTKTISDESDVTKTNVPQKGVDTTPAAVAGAAAVDTIAMAGNLNNVEKAVTTNTDAIQQIPEKNINETTTKTRVSLSWKDIGKITKTSVKDLFKGMVCDDDGKVNGWKVAGTVAAIVGVGAACYFAAPFVAMGLVHAGVAATAAPAAANALLATLALSPVIYNGTDKVVNGAKKYYTAQDKQEAERGMKEQMDGVVELASIPVLGFLFKGVGKGLNKIGIKSPFGKGKNKVKNESSAEKSKAVSNDAAKPANEGEKVTTGEQPKIESGKANETPTAEDKNNVTTRRHWFRKITEEKTPDGKLVKRSYKTRKGNVVEEFAEDGTMTKQTLKDSENNLIYEEEYSMNNKARVVTRRNYINKELDNIVTKEYRPNNTLQQETGYNKDNVYEMKFDKNETPTEKTIYYDNGKVEKLSNYDVKEKKFTKTEVIKEAKAEQPVEKAQAKAEETPAEAPDKAEVKEKSAEESAQKPEEVKPAEVNEKSVGKSEDAKPAEDVPETSKPADGTPSGEGAPKVKSTPEGDKAPSGKETSTETPAENKTTTKRNIFFTEKEYDAEGNLIRKSRPYLFRNGRLTKEYGLVDGQRRMVRKTYRDKHGFKITDEYGYTKGEQSLQKKTIWSDTNENQILKTEEYSMNGKNKVVKTTEYTYDDKGNPSVDIVYTDTYRPNSDKLLSRVGKIERSNGPVEYTIEYDNNGFPTKGTTTKHNGENIVDTYTDTYRPNSIKLLERVGKDLDSEYKIEYDENNIQVKQTSKYNDGDVEVLSDYNADIGAFTKSELTPKDGTTRYYELKPNTDGTYYWSNVPKPNPSDGIVIRAGKLNAEA